MNHGTFPGVANHGSVDGHFAPLGGVVLFPSWAAELVTIEDAVYLRSGSWVRATDTLLPSDSLWITKDGDIMQPGAPVIQMMPSGQWARQDFNGNTLVISNSSGTVHTVTAIRNGIIQPSSTLKITAIDQHVRGAFQFQNRQFAAFTDTVHSNSVLIDVADGGIVFTPGAAGVYQTPIRGFASIGSVGLLLPATATPWLSTLHRSANGGTSWAQLEGPLFGSQPISITANAAVFIAGDQHQPRVATSPSGLNGTWTLRTITGAAGGVRDCYCTPAGTLLVSMVNGQVMRSTDNGLTWASALGVADALIRRFTFDHFNGRIILTAVGTNPTPPLNGRIHFSIDDGITWQSYAARNGISDAIPLVLIQTIAFPSATTFHRGAVGVSVPAFLGGHPTRVGDIIQYLRIR